FSTGTSWQDYLLRADKMSMLSKKEVVEFANKWFKSNYIAVYKETGSDNTIQKIQKPQITPIEINRSSVSAFLNKIKKTPSKQLQPVFIDYQKDIQFGSRHRDVPIWLVPNKKNQLFAFSCVFDMGSYHDQKLPVALEYLNYIGSEHKSLEQINKELYKLAVNYKIYATTEQVYISLSGLEEHFEKALAIIDDLIRNPKPDQEALNKLVDSMIKERMDNTLNKDIIFRNALSNYADYGPINPFNQVISNEDLRKIQASELTQLVKSLFTYKHKVFYFGPRTMEDLSQYLRKTYGLKSRLNGYPQPRQFPKISPQENTVYFVDYDMVQTEIGFQRWDEPFDPGRMPIISAFNEYYGGGMSSIVFQEIREAKALAYSTYGFYSNPAKKEDPYKAGFYVGTQSDKLTEAFDAMITLIEDMPEAEQNWNVCKQLIQQNIEANRITKNSILYNYQSALRLGFNHDYRKDIYEQTSGISLMDIKHFHKEHMANKKWNIRVIGSKAKLNFESLSKYGKVVELSLEDVFGYKIEK
ncbi:MAG TPA: peptidase M16 inactive domain family protein, partial [Saprospirales bacterium]|nr:peptidase M16 inactive domain family protein [Saprospirales bacterium]